MKRIDVTYTDTFQHSPMTWWVGPRYGIWVQHQTNSGQKMKPKWQRTDAYSRHNLYARLEAHLDGINMYFATPFELDHFLEVISQKVLPSGGSLIRGRRTPGSPNSHWLSRFPARGKSFKFREKAVRFLTDTQPKVREFRAFYASKSFDETKDLFDGKPFVGTGSHNDPYRIAA